VVHIAPSEFGKKLLTTITDALSEKYPNKVVPNVGLCVALYDVTHVGESQLYPGNAAHHTTVEFRLVIFRPLVGEVLDGTLVSCDAQGVRISLGFFDEVHVPGRLLQEGSSWSQEEKLWVWSVPGTDNQKLFFDTQNPLRFRVEAVKFREPSGEAAAHAPPLADHVSESRAATPTPTPTPTPSRAGSQPASAARADAAAAAATPPPTPGSSGRNGQQASLARLPQALPPAMQIIGSMDRAGLGLNIWWPPDPDFDPDPEPDDVDAMEEGS
jgi:DNA-directed RNA polymerase III subunit RPC8